MEPGSSLQYSHASITETYSDMSYLTSSSHPGKDKVSTVHYMNAGGKQRYSSSLSQSRHQMGESGQILEPTVLQPREALPAPIEYEAGWTSQAVQTFYRREKPLLLSEIEIRIFGIVLVYKCILIFLLNGFRP